MMEVAYIGLGTNIEPRYQYIKESISLLKRNEHISVINISSIYETTPVGYLNQANFLNLVVKIKTTLSPLQLLNICQSIENQLERKRTIRYGPRTIDLDILIYNDLNKQTDRLTIPHPHMEKRAFVLIPLAEIAPHLFISFYNQTVKDLLDFLPEAKKQGIIKWRVCDQ